LINHNLGEIPHTIEIQVDEYGEWAIIKANAERSYCCKF